MIIADETRQSIDTSKLNLFLSKPLAIGESDKSPDNHGDRFVVFFPKSPDTVLASALGKGTLVALASTNPPEETDKEKNKKFLAIKPLPEPEKGKNTFKVGSTSTLQDANFRFRMYNLRLSELQSAVTGEASDISDPSPFSSNYREVRTVVIFTPKGFKDVTISTTTKDRKSKEILHVEKVLGLLKPSGDLFHTEYSNSNIDSFKDEFIRESNGSLIRNCTDYNSETGEQKSWHLKFAKDGKILENTYSKTKIKNEKIVPLPIPDTADPAGKALLKKYNDLLKEIQDAKEQSKDKTKPRISITQRLTSEAKPDEKRGDTVVTITSPDGRTVRMLTLHGGGLYGKGSVTETIEKKDANGKIISSDDEYFYRYPDKRLGNERTGSVESKGTVDAQGHYHPK